MAREETPTIAIVYDAVPNENKTRGGFMPVYEKNGKLHGDTYGRGFDRDEALALAKADALDEAAHYSGDWNVTVQSRATPAAKKASARRVKQRGSTRLGVALAVAGLGLGALLVGSRERGRR